MVSGLSQSASSAPSEGGPELSYLSAEERQRAGRYRFPEARNRFIVARAGLRLILARYLDVQPASIRLTQDVYGKPRLADPDQAWLRFNVAHSGDLFVVAVAHEREVGIDVEQRQAPPGRDWRAFKAYLSPMEQRMLSRIPADHADTLLVDLWTCKEAFGKARGVGLRQPVLSLGGLPATMMPLEEGAGSGMTRSEAASAPEHWTHDDGERLWAVRRFVPAHAAVAAVVIEAPDGAEPEIRCYEVVGTPAAPRTP